MGAGVLVSEWRRGFESHSWHGPFYFFFLVICLVNEVRNNRGAAGNRISNPKNSVSSRYPPRTELYIRRAAEYFWWNSRCQDSWWNAVSSVWEIFPIEKKNYRVKGEVKSSKSVQIYTGYPKLFRGCDFLCFYLMNLRSHVYISDWSNPFF